MREQGDSNGRVLWFTGLSGSGKTTTARAVAAELLRRGFRVELLDGDELRNTVCKGLGFSRDDRMENIRRIVYICKLLSRHGVTVLVSAIAPYRDMRAYAREQLPGYTEIFVDCPLEVCERRDVKGLYAKARRGEIRHFTGISDVYDKPERPDITVDTQFCTVEENSRRIADWVDDSAGAAERMHSDGSLVGREEVHK